MTLWKIYFVFNIFVLNLVILNLVNGEKVTRIIHAKDFR